MSKLDEIFATERRTVERQRAETPAAELAARICELPPTLGFLAALQASPHSLALIAEVKRASPSAGTIRADFDPAAIARAYGEAGAECLSVLTNEPYFGGRPEYLAICKAAAGRPCLRKDFIFDEYQLLQARAWGADAVLLIVAALAADDLKRLSEAAEALGLDVLVEVHTESEAEIALRCGSRLIGVNNRDLATFTTSIETSERILPMIRGHAYGVSESALDSPSALARVRAAGARAVLIGTAFCSEPDIGAAVRRVMER